MNARPYQLEIDRCIEAGWLRDIDGKPVTKQLVVSTMGSGKTVCFAQLVAKFVKRGMRALILVDQDELVHQAVRKIEAVTGLSVAVEKAERRAGREAMVVVASVQSLCRRLDNWPAEHFGIVIADEADKCFTYETLILTDIGPLPIGEIVEKRLRLNVASCTLSTHKIEWRPVTNWFRKPRHETYRVTHENGSFECSGNHKIWTEGGYVWAENLVPGMCLRAVREGLPSDKRVHQTSEVLQPSVQREVGYFTTNNPRLAVGQEQGSDDHEAMRVVREKLCGWLRASQESFLLKAMFSNLGGESTCGHRPCALDGCEMGQVSAWIQASRLFNPDEDQKPDLGPCEFGEDEIQVEGENVSVEGWQQQVDGTAKAFGISVELADGICRAHAACDRAIPIVAKLLQGGHCESKYSVSNRGGREFAQVETVEISRPQENKCFKRSRVVSVEVQERRSDVGPASSSFENRFLYDIEVAENHNYFANGVLVSNSLAKTWQNCLKHFDKTAKVVGFTATPSRGDCRSLGEYYEHIPFEAYFFDFIGNGKWAFDIVNTSAGEAKRVQKDWVSPIVVQMLPIKISIGDLGKRDFSDAEADEIITPHLEEIAKAIQHYASFRRTLIFLPLIQTCERFVEIAHSIGLAAANVSGPNIDVHGVLNQLRAGELDVVANSMLLSRGVDIPEVDALMVARVTKSVSLYQQFVGRGTRLAPGKTNLLLLDPLFVGDERMVCRPATLIARDAEDAENITAECVGQASMCGEGEQCEMDLMMQAVSAREKSLLRALNKQKDEKARLFSLDDLAARFDNPELSHFVPVTAEESRPVSAKQMKWLEKIVIDPSGKFFIGRGPQTAKPLDISGVTNEGHASRILTAAFDSKNRGIMMASFDQRRTMRKAGHPNWETATEREAKQFFADRNNRKKEPEFI